MKHKFTNDYSSLAQPQILKDLSEIAVEQNVAYGLDKHSFNAERYIKDVFESPNGQVYFLSGGTMTNLLFISYALRPYEAVIALESGHINVHETGAVEATGHKIITVKGKDGKTEIGLFCSIKYILHIYIIFLFFNKKIIFVNK